MLNPIDLLNYIIFELGNSRPYGRQGSETGDEVATFLTKLLNKNLEATRLF